MKKIISSVIVLGLLVTNFQVFSMYRESSKLQSIKGFLSDDTGESASGSEISSEAEEQEGIKRLIITDLPDDALTLVFSYLPSNSEQLRKLIFVNKEFQKIAYYVFRNYWKDFTFYVPKSMIYDKAGSKDNRRRTRESKRIFLKWIKKDPALRYVSQWYQREKGNQDKNFILDCLSRKGIPLKGRPSKAIREFKLTDFKHEKIIHEMTRALFPNIRKYERRIKEDIIAGGFSALGFGGSTCSAGSMFCSLGCALCCAGGATSASMTTTAGCAFVKCVCCLFILWAIFITGAMLLMPLCVEDELDENYDICKSRCDRIPSNIYCPFPVSNNSTGS